MNPGKNKCEYLKEVRRRIAKENGIQLEQRECTFKGECSGTCPFCEAEMRYIEKELHKRRTLGKAVTVAGIALSSVMLFPACGPKNALQGEPELPSEPDTTLAVTDTVPSDTLPAQPQETEAFPVETLGMTSGMVEWDTEGEITELDDDMESPTVQMDTLGFDHNEAPVPPDTLPE